MAITICYFPYYTAHFLVSAIYIHCSSSFLFYFIHINTFLSDTEKLFVCGHELGHAIMHPTTNTPFFQSNTLFSINRLENEANKVSAELNYEDLFFLDAVKNHWTLQQIAACLGINEKLVKYRISTITLSK